MLDLEEDAFPIDWVEIDFASMDDPFEGIEVKPQPSESEIIDGFAEAVLQDERLSHVDRKRLDVAARVIAKGLAGDAKALEVMSLLATGVEIANTPLGWMVSNYVKKCHKR